MITSITLQQEVIAVYSGLYQSSTHPRSTPSVGTLIAICSYYIKSIYSYYIKSIYSLYKLIYSLYSSYKKRIEELYILPSLKRVVIEAIYSSSLEEGTRSYSSKKVITSCSKESFFLGGGYV